MESSSIARQRIFYIKRFETITPLLLIVCGTVGIVLPHWVGIGFKTYVGYVFIAAALVHGVGALANRLKHFSGWIRPFLLTASALIAMFNEHVTYQSLGLVIGTYALVSGFYGTMSASTLASLQRILTLSVGLALIAIAILVLSQWPFSSGWMFSGAVGGIFLLEGITSFWINENAQKA